MNNTTLRQLLDQETPGGRGLLAAEICQKTNRQHGPVDGKCEVCGTAAESFVLQDWLRWHCGECSILASEHEHGLHHDAVVMDCDACSAEWKEITK
jgi:hypothetical protein